MCEYVSTAKRTAMEGNFTPSTRLRKIPKNPESRSSYSEEKKFACWQFCDSTPQDQTIDFTLVQHQAAAKK